VSVYVCLSTIILSELDILLDVLHLNSSPFFMHVTYGSGSVLSGGVVNVTYFWFMDDVIFAHNLTLLDVAARLRQ